MEMALRSLGQSYHILCTRYMCVCVYKMLSVLGNCCEILPVHGILYIYIIRDLVFKQSHIPPSIPQSVHRIQSKTWSISSTGPCLHRPATTRPPHTASHYFTPPHSSLIHWHMKHTDPSVIKVTINCTEQVSGTNRLLEWGHFAAGHVCPWIIQALRDLSDILVNAYKIAVGILEAKRQVESTQQII
jgi:hypothetical protein